jgi:DNA-binding transcriptional ArsR family regulator
MLDEPGKSRRRRHELATSVLLGHTTDLAENFNLAKPTLSKHFAVLREANLIHGEKNGTSITYSLNVPVFEDALISLMSSFKLSPRRRRR